MDHKMLANLARKRLHMAKGGMPKMEDDKYVHQTEDSMGMMDEPGMDGEQQPDNLDHKREVEDSLEHLALTDTYPTTNHEESDTMAQDMGFGGSAGKPDGELGNELQMGDRDEIKRDILMQRARKALYSFRSTRNE